MRVQVLLSDGVTPAYTPVPGSDSDEGLAYRCALDCKLHNRDNPSTPWVLFLDGVAQVTDAVTQTAAAATNTAAAA